MKDKKAVIEINSKIYEPKFKKLQFEVLLASSPTVVYRKEDNFFIKIYKFIKNKILGIPQIKDEFKKKGVLKYLEINIFSAAPEKIFKFIELSFEELKIFTNRVKSSSENSESAMFDLITGAINDSFLSLANSEKIIRLILKDTELEDGTDFIQYLTLEQRKAIIKAFEEVNPQIIETQKKILEMGIIPKEVVKAISKL